MTTQTKVTQGQAMLPILQTLLTHRAAGPQAIPFIVEESLKAMGLGLDVMGEKQGRPHVFIPFNNAGMELRFRGCIRSVGRNWEITDEGVEAVKTGNLPPKREGWQAVKNPRKPKTEIEAKGSKAPPQASTAAAKSASKTTGPKASAKTKTGGAQKAGSASPAPPAGDPAPGAWTPEDQAVLDSANNGLPFGVTETLEETADRLLRDGVVPAPQRVRHLTVVVGATPGGENAWVEDETIRALVANHTPCFGTFSPTHPACGPCPLRESCGSALAVGLSALAEAMAREAKRANAIPQGSIAGALPHARRGLNPAGTRTGPTVVRSMVTAFDGVCGRTGATISKNTLAYFIPGEGIVCESAITPEEREDAKRNDLRAREENYTPQADMPPVTRPS